MFFSSKDDYKALAREREQLLLAYSEVVRSLAQEYGVTELVGTGVIHPDKAATILRGILAGKADPKDASFSIPEKGEVTRTLPASIRNIEITGPLHVTVQRGDEGRVQVTCSNKKYLDKVTTEVHGDTIVIGMEPLSFISGSGSQVIQNAGGSVQISGSGNTVIRQNFHGQVGRVVLGDIVNVGEVHLPFGKHQNEVLPQLDFTIVVTLPNVQGLQVSGSGGLDYLDAAENELNVNCSGSGAVKLKGAIHTLRAKVSGSGGISAKDLKSSAGILHVSGSGSIKAAITESVDAKVTGSGSIRILGNPASQRTKVTGSGDIDFA